MSEALETIATAVRGLAAASAAYPDLRSRAERLAERLEQGRFHVAVLGAFKHGKSTLVNALIGEAVLPTGVLPLTTVATEVGWGRPGARVEHLDGTVLTDFLDRAIAAIGRAAKRAELRHAASEAERAHHERDARSARAAAKRAREIPR